MASSTFLGLPLELRHKIYEHLMPRIYAKTRRPQHRIADFHINVYNDLLLVCHQVHHEFCAFRNTHALLAAEAIVIRVKNFNFRPVQHFIASCSPRLLEGLRTSEAPVLVAKLCFCKHFRENMRSVGNEADVRNTHLGEWLQRRGEAAEAEPNSQIPVSCELGEVKAQSPDQILQHIKAVAGVMCPHPAGDPHPDFEALLRPLMPYFVAMSTRVGLIQEVYSDVFDASSSSEDESQVETRENLRRMMTLPGPLGIRDRPLLEDKEAIRERLRAADANSAHTAPGPRQSARLANRRRLEDEDGARRQPLGGGHEVPLRRMRGRDSDRVEED